MSRKLDTCRAVTSRGRHALDDSLLERGQCTSVGVARELTGVDGIGDLPLERAGRGGA